MSVGVVVYSGNLWAFLEFSCFYYETENVATGSSNNNNRSNFGLLRCKTSQAYIASEDGKSKKYFIWNEFMIHE
jgi:hypothetical protein